MFLSNRETGEIKVKQVKYAKRVFTVNKGRKVCN